MTERATDKALSTLLDTVKKLTGRDDLELYFAYGMVTLHARNKGGGCHQLWPLQKNRDLYNKLLGMERAAMIILKGDVR